MCATASADVGVNLAYYMYMLYMLHYHLEQYRSQLELPSS